MMARCLCLMAGYRAFCFLERGQFMSRIAIKRVSPERLLNVIDFRTPLGLFLTKEGRKWVAVDNSTGDAWTEEFSRKRQAVRWLRGKFEV